MTMKEFDGIIKGTISAAIIGLYIWVFDANAKNDVRDLRLTHVESGQREILSVVKDNTKAMNKLLIVIESLKNKKE
jgi:hypothetical protein